MYINCDYWWSLVSLSLLSSSLCPGPNISSIMYSPNGLHLATGLTNGEVQVFETSSSSSIFFLMKHKVCDQVLL